MPGVIRHYLSCDHAILSIQGNVSQILLLILFVQTGTFKNAEGFNSDITSWNVSNATRFVSATFIDGIILYYYYCNLLIILTHFCESYQYIIFLKDYMFENAIAFNQNINTWDVSNGTTAVSATIICSILIIILWIYMTLFDYIMTLTNSMAIFRTTCYKTDVDVL